VKESNMSPPYMFQQHRNYPAKRVFTHSVSSHVYRLKSNIVIVAEKLARNRIKKETNKKTQTQTKKIN
jgi:hypothetical protein